MPEFPLWFTVRAYVMPCFVSLISRPLGFPSSVMIGAATLVLSLNAMLVAAIVGSYMPLASYKFHCTMLSKHTSTFSPSVLRVERAGFLQKKKTHFLSTYKAVFLF